MSGFPSAGGAAPLKLTAPNSAVVPLTLQAAAAQSSDLFDVFASDGVTVLFSINNNAGVIQLPASGTTLQSGGRITLASTNSIYLNANGLAILSQGALQNAAGGGSFLVVTPGINFTTPNTGIGNGAATNLTALAKNTGTGPASMAAVNFIQIQQGGAVFWVPCFQ